ncbi:hypothetical protein [Bacillus infantis]|uniref:hypothetical protein n=1 Tax=Bacillus infantis TaxID=324767 RepID=UPI003CEA694F
MTNLKRVSDQILVQASEVKAEFIENVLKKFGSNNTIMFYCRLYEYFIYEYITEHQKYPDYNSKQLYSLSEIIKWVWSEDFEEDNEYELDETEFYKLVHYFEKAFNVHQSSSAFLSEYATLFRAEIINDNNITFNYKTKEIGFFENVNHVLITEYRLYKSAIYGDKVQKARKRGRYLHPRYLASMLIDTEFHLFPSNYRILRYTIAQIKEFWENIYEVVIGERKEMDSKFINWAKKGRKLEEFSEIPIIKIDITTWNFKELTQENAIELLDIFSFNGKKKLKGTIHSSLISEPIVKLRDSSYILMSFALPFYEPERYSLQVLDKYIDYYEKNKIVVWNDQDKRETLFIDRLNIIFKDFIYKNSSINIPNSNIDYIIYDEKTESLVCFELKWIIEPNTPSEIKSKDKPLEKALSKQLPTYKRAVQEHTTEVLEKAFGRNFTYSPKNYFYFLLTNVTVGSGLLDRNDFKIINIRMLQKALRETENDLQKASEILEEERYIIDIENYFELVISNHNIFGVNISQPEGKYLGGFSLL